MEPQETCRHIKETPLPHLPQEIIDKILVRLPVKSLLRLKSVSKAWHALISSNGFIKAHLEKSSNNKSFEHHRIILGNSIIRANQCFLPSFSHEPLVTAINFDYPMCGSDYGPCYIIGSCNGVVCIVKNAEDYILWNPSTRKFKRLPAPILDDNERGVYCAVPCTLGFGFDESNDDYNLFRMSMDHFERKGLVKVYSLKTDSWRNVGVFPLDSPFVGLGIYASGKLHWNRYGSDWVIRGIVSFDLENEIFGTVELPKGVKEECFLGPETIDGCFCCICPNDSKPDDHADYWLLKGYGENDSWHKFATLERPLRDEVSYEYYLPIFVGAGGDIFCWDREYAIYTVLFKKEDGFLGSDVHDLYTKFSPALYFESLVGL